MGETSKELLQMIPLDKCWDITAKNLLTISVLRGVKTVLPLLGKGEGIISPVWGWEKWLEILNKILADGAGKFYPRVKEKLNIPVKDAIEAAKLETAVATLYCGPEQENEYPEATSERVVLRVTKCAWWERYNELKVDPELRGACDTCKVWCEEGFKAINPRITRKYTKTMQRGDLYCENIIEFKEE